VASAMLSFKRQENEIRAGVLNMVDIVLVHANREVSL